MSKYLFPEAVYEKESTEINCLFVASHSPDFKWKPRSGLNISKSPIKKIIKKTMRTGMTPQMKPVVLKLKEENGLLL